MAAFFVFSACVYPAPDVVGAGTLALLLASVSWSGRAVRGFMLMWIMLVAVAKLIFQLPWVDEFDSEQDLLKWFGFVKVGDRTASVILRISLLLPSSPPPPTFPKRKKEGYAYGMPSGVSPRQTAKANAFAGIIIVIIMSPCLSLPSYRLYRRSLLYVTCCMRSWQ